MKACLVIIVLVMASIVAVQTSVCPADWFPAVFTATIDQVADKPVPFNDDPEFYFFKNVMKFRDEAIQHTTEDAIQFFNDSYGLDFSGSSPNAQNERFFQNARMNPVIVDPNIRPIVTSNNWIRTGSTRSSCYNSRDGGFHVTFSGDQTLYGSYGGMEGKPARAFIDFIAYGFYCIEVCSQSPVVIQYQSRTPFRLEPIDGFAIINCDLYNEVLGHGKALGVAFFVPATDGSGRCFVTVRNSFTFPSSV